MTYAEVKNGNLSIEPYEYYDRALKLNEVITRRGQ